MPFNNSTDDNTHESLRNLVSILSEENEAQAKKIEHLEAQLRLFKKQWYQSRSEKHPNQGEIFQDSLFNEIEYLKAQEDDKEQVTEIAAHKRKKRKPRSLSKALPRVEVIHDISKEEKCCPCGCGAQAEYIGDEKLEQLAIIPAVHYVICHVKKKYAHRCQRKILRASIPAQPIPKSQASPVLLAYLMVSKYLDGLPLYRLEKIMARSGLNVSRQTLARWMIQTSHWFDRVIRCFDERIQQYDILGADETRLQVLREPGRSAQTKSWLWIRRGGPPDKPVVLIDYSPTRASSTPNVLLKNYRGGYLVVDAYPGYNTVAKQNGLTIVGCHDHARRKFIEAFDSLSPKQKRARGGIAKHAIERYKALYKIEQNLKQQGASPQKIQQMREELSSPRLIAFRDWLLTVKEKAIMTEKTRMAVNYFLNQFSSLTVYCTDGRLPMSNILSEHVAKKIAIARKNFLFANTPSGAQASAKLFSVLLTALTNDLEPIRYATLLLTKLPTLKGQSIEHLMPWNLSKEKLDAFYAQIPKP